MDERARRTFSPSIVGAERAELERLTQKPASSLEATRVPTRQGESATLIAGSRATRRRDEPVRERGAAVQ
jgi:hypothetical protein